MLERRSLPELVAQDATLFDYGTSYHAATILQRSTAEIKRFERGSRMILYAENPTSRRTCGSVNSSRVRTAGLREMHRRPAAEISASVSWSETSKPSTTGNGLESKAARI